MKICSRCIYDEKIKGISFDANGVCNYCIQTDNLNKIYQPGTPEAEKKLFEIFAKIKKDGIGKKYDCIIGLSGGTDSSYLLCKAVEWGLRPLGVHYDNTWNTSISTENIRKVTKYADIDLWTYVIDNKEADDIFRAFFFACVPEFDAGTDIGFSQVLRDACAKFKIKYVLEGHSYQAEGLTPQASNYFDGKYIADIHKTFGKKPMKTFPNMTFKKFLKSILFYRVQFIRPLWYLDYSKEAAQTWLEENTGWHYYGGHHLENRSSGFVHSVYHPQKFNMDNRNWSLAAAVRSGKMTRQAALDIYSIPRQPDLEIVRYLKKRLEITDKEYDQVMTGVKRSWKDFKTYKKRFELWRPFFYIMAKSNRVTMSFYLKYCFPMPPNKEVNL